MPTTSAHTVAEDMAWIKLKQDTSWISATLQADSVSITFAADVTDDSQAYSLQLNATHWSVGGTDDIVCSGEFQTGLVAGHEERDVWFEFGNGTIKFNAGRVPSEPEGYNYGCWDPSLAFTVRTVALAAGSDTQASWIINEVYG